MIIHSFLEIALIPDNIVNPPGTLKTLGPAYEITFELKVNEFNGQILHLTTNNPRSGLCFRNIRRWSMIKIISIGDGIPTVVASERKVLDVYTDINGKNDVKFSSRKLETDTWYDVTISQKPSEDNPKVVCKESFWYENVCANHKLFFSICLN